MQRIIDVLCCEATRVVLLYFYIRFRSGNSCNVSFKDEMKTFLVDLNYISLLASNNDFLLKDDDSQYFVVRCTCAFYFDILFLFSLVFHEFRESSTEN